MTKTKTISRNRSRKTKSVSTTSTTSTTTTLSWEELQKLMNEWDKMENPVRYWMNYWAKRIKKKLYD